MNMIQTYMMQECGTGILRQAIQKTFDYPKKVIKLTGLVLLVLTHLVLTFQSAASPKEIVILLDTSGSMTGLRKEIAKHVVLNILETLSEDDFVTIYSFSKTPRPLVKCFSREDDEGMERAELVQV